MYSVIAPALPSFHVVVPPLPEEAPFHLEQLPSELKLNVFEALIGLPDTAGARAAFAAFPVFAPVQKAAELVEELNRVNRPEGIRARIERLSTVPPQYSAACWKAAWTAMERAFPLGMSPTMPELLDGLLAVLPTLRGERLLQLHNAARWAGAHRDGKSPSAVLALLQVASEMPNLPAQLWADLMALVRPSRFSEEDAQRLGELAQNGAFGSQQRTDLELLVATCRLPVEVAPRDDICRLIRDIERRASPCCRVALLRNLRNLMDTLSVEDQNVIAEQMQRALLQKDDPAAARRMAPSERFTALLALPRSASHDPDCALLLEEVDKLPPLEAAKILAALAYQFVEDQPESPSQTRLLAFCEELMERWRNRPARAPAFLGHLASVCSGALKLHSGQRDLEFDLMVECTRLPGHQRIKVLLEMHARQKNRPSMRHLICNLVKKACKDMTWNTPVEARQSIRAIYEALRLPVARSDVLSSALQALSVLAPYEQAEALEVIGHECLGDLERWKACQLGTFPDASGNSDGKPQPADQVAQLLELCSGLPPHLRERPQEVLEVLQAKERKSDAEPARRVLSRSLSGPPCPTSGR